MAGKGVAKKLIWVLVAALAVDLVLRIPSLFEPYSYADEGIYLVLGQGFRKGLVFYRDIHDNKPPLLYVVAGLSQSLTNFRLWLMIWNLVNVWLVWLVAKMMFKNKFWPVLVSSLGFGLVSSMSFWEGNIANGELFMIMPFTAAVYLVIKAVDSKKWKDFFLAGVLAAAGFLFKVPIGFDLAALGLWILWVKGFKGLRQVVYLGLGFLVPNVLVGAYYFYQGAGQRYLASALLQNIPYLTSWGGGGTGGGLLASGLGQRGLMVMLMVLTVFWFKKRFDRVESWLWLWLGFSMFGVLLSERPYPHYLMEAAVVLSLIGGGVVAGGVKKKVLGVVAGVMVWLALAHYSFWTYPTRAYYANFIGFVTGRQSRESYERYWGDNVLIDQQVAEYIKLRTGEDDWIYVWGTAPGIYYLSARLPVGRYTVAYHVADFDGFDEEMEKLRQKKPKVIVRLQSEGLRFEGLDELIKTEYRLGEMIGDRAIYLRAAK